MKVNRVEFVTNPSSTSSSASLPPDPSIIIAGGRDAPHHTATEVSPDANPPPIMVGWIGDYAGSRDAYTALSTDGGKTWSEPRRVVDPSDSSFDSLTLFSEGQLSFAFLARAGQRGMELRAFKTSDLGTTWEALEVDLDSPGDLIPGGRLLSYCGHYLLPVHSGPSHSDSLSYQAALLSHDLFRWHMAPIIPDAHEVGLADGQVTHTQPGEHEDGLIMVSRVVAAPAGEIAAGHASFSLSTDCGDSWSPSEPYLEVPSFGTPVYFATDSLGRYVAVFNTESDRHTLKVRVKEPRGPWGPVHDFPSPGETNGSVDAVECAAGRYYCAFTVDDRSIAFADVAP